jgi:heterodisulfide reductase subunit C
MSKQSELIKEISGVNPLKCMKCGKCTASCPAYSEMDIKPHQFVSYVINDDIESLLASKSVQMCLSCFACVERCPRNVQPGRLVDAARQMVVRQRGEEMFSPEDIPCLAEADEDVPQQLLVSAFRKYRR